MGAGAARCRRPGRGRRERSRASGCARTPQPCRFDCGLSGVVAPWLDPNAGRPFVDYARPVNRTRAGYLKGSPLELLAKKAGNSLYGKTGQGVGEMKTTPTKRRAFDSRSGESRLLPPSRITSPLSRRTPPACPALSLA